MVLRKLAISNFRVRRARSILTIAAIAVSVSLIVAVTSGYKSMELAALKFINQFMGASDAFVVPSMQGKVRASLVDDLRSDPDVRAAVGRLQSMRDLPRKKNDENESTSRPDHSDTGGAPPDAIGTQLIGILRAGDDQTDTMEVAQGKWFEGAAGNVAVLDQSLSDRLGLKLGDDLLLPRPDEPTPLKLKIVGLVHKPTFFAERSATVYLPIATLQAYTRQNDPPLVSRIAIDLKGTANLDAFKKRWTERLASSDFSPRLRMRRDNAGELDKKLSGLHILSYFGGAVSMMTAMFITFSALSMGVTERQRTLAMLRAIGATRGQVARLVLLEAIIFAVIGLILGILLGMLWTTLLCLRFPDLFADGASFSLGGIGFAAAGSLLTALAASLLPAWMATRLNPIEAMNAHGASAADRPPILLAILGAALASIDPFIFFGPMEKIVGLFHAGDPELLTQSVRLVTHFLLGLPALMFGFFLLAPLFVWIIERVFAPLVALILGLPMKLLRQQLSGGIWRAAGTAAALMVGLSTLVVMQVQGNSLIGGWQLPDKFPDIFIWGSDLISWQDQEKLAKIPGIEPGALMPCVVTTPHGDSDKDLWLAKTFGGDQIGVMFFAVYPKQALSMIHLEYRDNDGKVYPPERQEIEKNHVIEEMKKGRRIIITDELRQARHLKIGDLVSLQTSNSGMQTYTVCGIVWSPGVDVVIAMYDLGNMLDQQTLGSVFGSIDDAKRDFGATGARLFAANLQGGVDKEQVLKDVQKSLGDRGLRAGDVRHIKYTMEHGFQRLLLLLSSVAFAAMAVASLGVTNTVMASVRTRRWQFGVLRSIGISRADLLKLVLAESILLGLVGIALGISAGLLMSIDARELGGAVLGVAPPIVIPWGIVAIGCLAVMLVSIGASIIPAINAARTQVLDLLQAGRAST